MFLFCSDSNNKPLTFQQVWSPIFLFKIFVHAICLRIQMSDQVLKYQANNCACFLTQGFHFQPLYGQGGTCQCQYLIAPLQYFIPKLCLASQLDYENIFLRE